MKESVEDFCEEITEGKLSYAYHTNGYIYSVNLECFATKSLSNTASEPFCKYLIRIMLVLICCAP